MGVRERRLPVAPEARRGRGCDGIWNRWPPVHDAAAAAARGVIDAAREGDARRALEALGSFRVLCAHRRGPYSVAMWLDRLERWLAAEVGGFGAEGRWYVGRPLLVTEND
jgi:exodeoxyribonuclease V alpha subunit